MKKKFKKKKNKMGLIVLLLLITVGYALLSSSIGLKGSSKIKDASWDVHLENVNVSSLSHEAEEDATIDSTRKNVNYKVTLDIPGDFYEFTVDVVNNGTLDAMIESITSEIKINDNDFIEVNDTNLPNYLKYQVTYENGSKIENKQELLAGDRKTYKIRVEYNKNINPNDLPTKEENLEFNFTINYIQKDETAVEIKELSKGKYVTITPDLTEYLISKEDSGYDDDQTINPKELTLWRIIKTNEDGSFDAVSEYTSSKNIILKGEQGYKNLVDTLVKIGSSYINTTYTTKSRIMGYDNQTSTLTQSITSDNTPLNVTSTTLLIEGDGREYLNGLGGDNLYIKDYLLVKNIYKNNPTTYGSSGLIGYNVNTKEKDTYYLPSRIYFSKSNKNYSFNSLIIDTDGALNRENPLYKYYNEWESLETSAKIRPIITIKKDVTISSGNGLKNNPYILD